MAINRNNAFDRMIRDEIRGAARKFTEPRSKKKHAKSDRRIVRLAIVSGNTKKWHRARPCYSSVIVALRKEFSRDKARYAKYLETGHWKKLRRRLVEERKCCLICAATEQLQLHHLNYRHLFNERETDLQLLCGDCHATEHGLAFLSPLDKELKAIIG